VVDEWKMTPTEWHQHSHLWTVGDGKPTPLLELNQDFKNLHPQFSPVGKRLLCKVVHYGSSTEVGNGSFNTTDFKFNNLLVIDLTTKKQTAVEEYGGQPEWRVGGYAWSPDGKQIACVETQSRPQQSGAPRAKDSFRVMVADPDGKNEKEVHKADGS
jgi:Tol biopolymer transport system component